VADSAASKNLIGILISGRGSNMRAILDRIASGALDARAVLVISNEAKAAGLAVAREFSVPTLVIDHRDSTTREEHDAKMAEALESKGVHLVCLAGYMRLLSPEFVERFKGRILNIHPSLLPAFPGREAQRQAFEAGVKLSGCTVHYVDEHVDSGPIVLQEAIPVLDEDDAESLAARILEKEHDLYCHAIALHFSGGLRVSGRRVLGTQPR
jgi:phosphoribosylglycinamide formyltransferase 1